MTATASKASPNKRFNEKNNSCARAFKSLYISLPSSAKQQRKMTKFYVFWRAGTAMANFWKLLSELNAVGAC